MVKRDKKRLTNAAALAATIMLLLGTGMVLGTQTGEAAGDISVRVKGAVSVSVFCGGEHTWHTDGELLTFSPDGARCEIEAPLSAVMPLRGTLEIEGSARSYECGRVRMDLVCSGS
jgi:hypothetical protein